MADVSRPPPPKRPTIIRPQAHSESTEIKNKSADTDEPILRRPAQPPGGSRPPPKPPNRPPSFRDEKKGETEKVQLRDTSNKNARPASFSSKGDNTSKRKIEITVVSARPMSEVGFRDVGKSSMPQSRSEVKVEPSKLLTELKMTPPTSLVPDRSFLPPRPNKPESSPQQRPPPPVPLRKDMPSSPDTKAPPKSIESPSLKPQINKSSPESPSPRPRSNVPVPVPEKSPPLLPRKSMTLPSRPLPPTPSPGEEETLVTLETPTKPQRTYMHSVDNESQLKTQFSLSDKPRRPTIIRPAKQNKNDTMQKVSTTSQEEKSVSAIGGNTVSANGLPPVPTRNFKNSSENLKENSEKVDKMTDENHKDKDDLHKEHITDSKDTRVIDEVKKPPIATKPKPTVLPKPKLKQQANVTEDDFKDFEEKSANEKEIKKFRKPTIIRASVSKQSCDEKDISGKTTDNVEDIPDYASIHKPATGETSETKPIIPTSLPSTKPPPPVPAKRFSPPVARSKDDFEVNQKSDVVAQIRPKPAARARPMSMMVTSSAGVGKTSPMKPPPPNVGAHGKSSPSKPPQPSFGNSTKPSQNQVKSEQSNLVDVSIPEHSEQNLGSPIGEKEDHKEDTKSKPGRPKAAPSRPSHGPIRSPVDNQGSKKESLQHEKPVQKEVAPDLPSRPGPGHPLYRYMLTVPHGQAIHDYEGENPEDLSFKEKDIVVLHKRIDEAWLHGQVGEKEGIFPQSFIHILRPFNDEVQTFQNEPSIPEDISDSDSSPSHSTKQKSDWIRSGPRCVARFDFEGEGSSDLCFEEGDYIKLLERIDSEWLKGELHGQIGIFPMTFVEIIEDLSEPTEVGQDTFTESDQPRTPVETVESFSPKHEEIQNKAHLSTGTVCQAVADFPQGSPDDLSFCEGDVIEITGVIDENWLRGRLKDREGIFPSSFVVQLENHTLESEAFNTNNVEAEERFGEALYDFEGENDNELSFKAGDRIQLGTTVEGAEDWQWGQLDGLSGIFPSAFVHVIS